MKSLWRKSNYIKYTVNGRVRANTFGQMGQIYDKDFSKLNCPIINSI